MNILLINHYAGSPEMGMEFRPYYFAREWVKMGHRVDIIAADYSHLRRINPTVNKDFQEELIDGIHYHWIKTRTYEGNGAKRAITMAQFVGKLWLNSKKIISEFQPDVVICSSTYPLDTFVGQKIRRKSKKKVKLIHEVHDMWPATLVEVGGMSKYNPFVVAMQIGENSAYKNSDYVVSLLPNAEAYMKEHGLREGRFIEIPNGIVIEDWDNPARLPEGHEVVLKKLKLERKYIVGYFGGHALSNALEVLIECAEKVKNEEICFVLVGDGVEKDRLKSIVNTKKLNNVVFLNPINKRAIPSLCEYFDIIYMGGKASPLYRFGLCMNKMFDSFMAGKPIICAITATDTPISKNNCGIMVNSMDVEGILNAIDRIRKMNQEGLESLSLRARKLAEEKYSYEILANSFECLFF